MREYRITAGWGCLGLLAGTAVIAGWLALISFSAAAAVLAEIAGITYGH